MYEVTDRNENIKCIWQHLEKILAGLCDNSSHPFWKCGGDMRMLFYDLETSMLIVDVVKYKSHKSQTNGDDDIVQCLNTQ